MQHVALLAFVPGIICQLYHCMPCLQQQLSLQNRCSSAESTPFLGQHFPVMSSIICTHESSEQSAHHAGRAQARVHFKGKSEAFDGVVLATHSDTALQLRGSDATDQEASVLRAMPYNDNDVYLHTGVGHALTCCTKLESSEPHASLNVRMIVLVCTQ